jgi:hypothetical protein
MIEYSKAKDSFHKDNKLKNLSFITMKDEGHTIN